MTMSGRDVKFTGVNYIGVTFMGMFRVMLSACAAAVGVVPLSVLAQAPPQLTAKKMTRTIGPGIQRRFDTLPQVLRQEFGQHPQPPAVRVVDPLGLAARKAQAARPLTVPLRGNATPPVSPQFAPFTLQQNLKLTPPSTIAITSQNELASCSGVVPADQALAVGDASGSAPGVLQVINDCVSIFDKAGILQAGYPKSLTTFFGLPASTPTTDPRAFFDWINHRYVFVMIQFDPTQNTRSSYWVAASTTDNPTGSYCTVNIPVQSVNPSTAPFPLPDFPRLGQDRQAIYLASNIFPTTTTFQWEEILILPKSQLYACNALTITTFADLNLNGVVTDSTQPANIYSASDDPRSAYFVTALNGNFADPKNGLVVWTLYNPLSSPTFSGILVPTTNNYSTPPLASQPTAALSIDTGDNRISGMVFYASGSLYASLNTNGSGGAPACILYQIHPFINSATGLISSATILNEIVLGSGTSGWYYCTQQPDPEGNVTTVYNFSDASNYASLGYVSRRAGQPTGTLPDGGLTLLAGSAPAYTGGRWGDYTAVAPAGLVSGGGTGGFPSMWFAGMYGLGTIWGTAIGKNGYNGITQP